MKIICYQILIIASFTSILVSQKRCATDEYWQNKIQNNPDLIRKKTQLDIQAAIYQKSVLHKTTYNVLHVPVVVHIIYNNSLPVQNISDIQVQSQITVLNQDFRKMLGTPGWNSDPVGADTQIDFYLATIDPYGNPTTGITRTQTTALEYQYPSEDMKYSMTGGCDVWAPKKYLNIWVANIISDEAAWATSPVFAGELFDGIVCDYKTFGNMGTAVAPYNMGRKITHEVGHYFGLEHTWGIANDLGCNGTDYVDDTPPCNGRYWSGQSGTCIKPTQCGFVRQIENYMDYSNDACMNLFTQGQSTRMRGYVESARISLFQTVSVSVTVDQTLENDNSRVGNVQKWNTGFIFNPVTLGQPFSNTRDLPLTLKADQNSYSGQKYHLWSRGAENQNDVTNHHIFFVKSTDLNITSKYKIVSDAKLEVLIDGLDIGGVSYFYDPWFQDYSDPNFNGAYRNRGMNAIPYSLVNGSSYYNIGTNSIFNGVFLNENLTFDPLKTNYKIGLPSTQPISGLNTYFLGWDGTNTIFQNASSAHTGAVFTGSGAVASAKYKAQQRTVVNTGLINGGQRKIVRTGDGVVHTVYESAGRVWYERKVAGGNWELAGGSDVVGSDAKLPSISSRGNNIIIVYQKKNMSNNSNYDIEYKMFDYGGFPQTSSVIVSNISSYSDDAQPVVASNSSGKTFIAWRQTSNSGAAGIYYSAGIVSSSGIYAQSIYGKMSSTDNYSSTPSVAVGNTADNYGKYHYPFAWTQNNTIKYRDIQYTNNGQWLNYTNGGEIPLSAGSGYTYNYNPSVICYGANSARIAWIGKRFEEDPGESMGKTGAAGGKWAYRVIYNQDASSTFEVYGDYVNSVVINKNNNGSGDVSHAVAWSSSNGSVTTTRTSNGLFGEFRINSNQINGRDVQLSNGSSFSDMYGYMLDVNTSAPYKLLLSDNDISTVQKVQFSAVNNGKEGVVYDSIAQFYFAIGDIVVDGNPIGFDTEPDTTKTLSLTYLNSKLECLPISISNNSKLYYSVQYGLTDSTFGALALKNGNTVNFKVQLLDDQTNSLIGEYDNITFSSLNLNQYHNIGYEVNTEGLGNKTVRLRLVVNAFPEAHYSLANRFDQESIISLGKSNSRRIKTRFDGSAIITDYTLSQNYPNPFNPTTTIRYTLPREGDVTLNIYDLLGKNVMTLVNKYQQSGRYEIEFDAVKLSSGTYIYKLTSGSFNQTKKMMLVK